MGGLMALKHVVFGGLLALGIGGALINGVNIKDAAVKEDKNGLITTLIVELGWIILIFGSAKILN